MILFGLLLATSGGAKWTVALAGDIMLNQVSAKRSPFAGAEVLFKTDVALANLEVPLTAQGRPTVHKSRAELAARSQFVLRASPDKAKWIAAAGIKMVSLGNNHAMDYGAAGLLAMIKRLDETGIKHTGAGANKDLAASVTTYGLPNGMKVGMISGLAFLGAGALGHCSPAGPDRPGVNALSFGGKPDRKRIAFWVKSARRHCDFLIVALHGGIERKTRPTSYQIAIAHAFIDAGADVVWGHHPHVLQGAEIYRGHPILYSMGNLVSPTPAVGGVVQLTYDGSRFESAEFEPIRIAGGHVRPDKGKAAKAARKRFVALCRQTARQVHGKPLPFEAE